MAHLLFVVEHDRPLPGRRGGEHRLCSRTVAILDTLQYRDISSVDVRMSIETRLSCGRVTGRVMQGATIGARRRSGPRVHHRGERSPARRVVRGSVDN